MGPTSGPGDYAQILVCSPFNIMLNFAQFEDGMDKCPTTGKYRKTLEKRKSLCTLLFCCYSSFV